MPKRCLRGAAVEASTVDGQRRSRARRVICFFHRHGKQKTMRPIIFRTAACGGRGGPSTEGKPGDRRKRETMPGTGSRQGTDRGEYLHFSFTYKRRSERPILLEHQKRVDHRKIGPLSEIVSALPLQFFSMVKEPATPASPVRCATRTYRRPYV